MRQVFIYPNADLQIPEIRTSYLNNTYVGRLVAITSLVLSRRTFLAGVGSTAVLVGACGVTAEAPASDPAPKEIEKIISLKQILISDATDLIARDPSLGTSLQVVVDQNLIHIAALNSFLTPGSSPSATTTPSRDISLPALATRCAVFSTNNLSVASGLPDAELSRLLALIAGSEMQHHALLSGLIA